MAQPDKLISIKSLENKTDEIDLKKSLDNKNIMVK